MYQANIVFCCCLVTIVTAVQGVGGEVEGFTEPYRIVNVASSESGVIMTCDVQEGDTVEQDQVLGTLDRDVHLALLAIAEKSAEAKGKLNTATAELEMKNERLTKMQDLRERGHARQEEVDRAQADAAIAEGKVQTAREELLIRELERRKIETQVERRVIRAPMDGVVTKLHKQIGEYLPPTDPRLLTIVELDPLLATFSVMSDVVARLNVGDSATLSFADQSEPIVGTIEFIAPVIDAESGTVRVKIRIENPGGHLLSGQRCSLQVSDGS